MKFNSIFLKMLTVGLFFSNSVSFGMNEFTLGLGETTAGAEVFNKYNFQQAVDQMVGVVDQAVANVNFNKIKALLAAAAPGVDVNYAHKYGYNALMLAAKSGHTDIVKLLLAMPEINVNAAANNGRTALILAAQFGDTDMVRLLLAMPDINVNAAANNGDTA